LVLNKKGFGPKSPFLVPILNLVIEIAKLSSFFAWKIFPKKVPLGYKFLKRIISQKKIIREKP